MEHEINMNMRKLKKSIWMKICSGFYYCSPILETKILYRFAMNKKLNLSNPKTFNEKIQWLKLYYKNPLVSKCADKYMVREYVRECGLENTLNEIYGVYENADNIDFGVLPNKFVIKCTHGSGYNIICTDKSKLNIEDVKKKLNKWMKSRYSVIAAEIQYDDIKPRIIIEKYLGNEENKIPLDYKLFCFDGKVRLTMVCEGRYEKTGTKFYYFNNDWTMLPFDKESRLIYEGKKECKIERPETFEKMMFYAEKLSEGFPFVRVDFYEYNKNVILGEMTFTPCAGLDSTLTEESDLLLGNMINLPQN